ncbi:MAG: ThuA domain-containing protein, partial [Opitutaceae bacterium]
MSIFRHTLLAGARALGFFASIPSVVVAHAAEFSADFADKRVLVFSGTGWYRHPEIPLMNGWLVRLGAAHGMQVDITETAKDITPERLTRYRVLVMNNCNELDKVFDEKQRAAIERWYANGGGIVALHAALVRQQKWPWFHELAGCDFDSDSDFLEARVMVDPAARDHPAVKGHGLEFTYKADWTNHTASVTGLPGVQVLLRVDEKSYVPVRPHFVSRGGNPMGADHPVAWTREWGGGRFFYTEFGHGVNSLETAFARQHILEGI